MKQSIAPLPWFRRSCYDYLVVSLYEARGAPLIFTFQGERWACGSSSNSRVTAYYSIYLQKGPQYIESTHRAVRNMKFSTYINANCDLHISLCLVLYLKRKQGHLCLVHQFLFFWWCAPSMDQNANMQKNVLEKSLNVHFAKLFSKYLSYLFIIFGVFDAFLFWTFAALVLFIA